MSDAGEPIDDLDDQVDAVAEQMDALLDDDPQAVLSMAKQLPVQLATHPTLRLLVAHATMTARTPAAALSLFEQLAQDFPQDADIRYSLGRVYEQLDQFDAMVEQYSHVLQLDGQDDQVLRFDEASVSAAIMECVKRVIDGLPNDFRERLSAVPIVVEARPSIELVSSGFDPRSVGLFEGPDHREQFWENPTMPPRIVIYSANLTAMLDPDDHSALEREVEITVLHEIGHYFGLDEEQLTELGLD